jgi:NTE family protein
VKDAANPEGSARPAARSLQRYREMQAFQNSRERPYIHLVDGGVADNIGVRAVLEALEELQFSAAFRGQTGADTLRRVVLIVVNARSAPRTDWDRVEAPPGTVAQLLQASGVPIDRYSFETVELMKDFAEIVKLQREVRVARARLAGASEAQAEASVRKISAHVLDVSFDAIDDPQERASFMNLRTSFALPAGDVDRLREVAGRVLRQSPEYDSLVLDFGGSKPK